MQDINKQYALQMALQNIPAKSRGAALAWALGYAGDDIFDLLCDALTDSNFHEETKAIKKAYMETMQFS